MEREIGDMVWERSPLLRVDTDPTLQLGEGRILNESDSSTHPLAKVVLKKAVAGTDPTMRAQEEAAMATGRVEKIGQP